jgi:predicted dithiol-disulfide oxidoreductase (DUF899 family)
MGGRLPELHRRHRQPSVGFFAHLDTRDTSYAMVSRAPLAKLERWKAKKGWDVPWYFSFGTHFNYDFGVTIDESVAPGEYNCLVRFKVTAASPVAGASPGGVGRLDRHASNLKWRIPCDRPRSARLTTVS